MHIPDGFIDGKTALVTAALSVAGVGWALRRVGRELPPRKVPLLGLSAAFLFAAQMINFPVFGGTSGHLLGGVLVAVLLGPSAALVVVSTVLIVQAFLFGDGGVSALGANVFNMAIVGVGGGYGIYRLVSFWVGGDRGRITAILFAGWCSTVLASVSCAGQLAWSGKVSWPAVVMAMSGVHMVIGLGEGFISALAYMAVVRMRPDMIGEGTGAVPARGFGDLALYGGLVSLGLALFVAPFACSWPDGLESVAARLGFGRLGTVGFPAPAAEYHVPGMHWAVGAAALAGAAGTLVVFILSVVLGRVLMRGKVEVVR